MSYQPETPFDSIEGAQEYLALLSEVIAESRREVEADGDLLLDESEARRHEALLVVSYKLAKLESHLLASRRLLNDLRMLRRLLLSERQPAGDSSAESPVRTRAAAGKTPGQ